MIRLLPFFAAVLSVGITAQISVGQSLAGKQITTVCLVRHLDEIDIPAKRDGVISVLKVRRGSPLAEDQLLAIIDGGDAEAELAVAKAEYARAKLKAANKWQIRVAGTDLERTETKANLVQQLGQDAAYLERFDAHNSRVKSVAELNAAKAVNREDIAAREVAGAELAVAERNVTQRQIASPVGGSVTEIHRDQGEWVNRGDKIMTVVRLDRLQIEGFVSLNEMPPHKIIGARARATIEVAGQFPVVLDNLTITHASPTTELDGKYLVWTEIDNRSQDDRLGVAQWFLRPGMSGKLEILTGDDEPSESRPSPIAKLLSF